MEQSPEPSQTGSVVLDIGGDIGAAILVAPPSLTGVEIEVRRSGEPWAGRHVAVRARHLPDGTVHAAVFEALKHGRYEARIRDNDRNQSPCRFQVKGGRVASAELGY
jgi:hypothetical protein